MRRCLIVALALWSPFSCKDKQGSPAAATQPAIRDAAQGVEPKASHIEHVPTKEDRQAYRSHLRAGREHAKAGRWIAAAEEFDSCLEAIPMDGRALSELGWAAFKAGDYARARIVNVEAAQVSADVDLKAASFYNLGRIAEELDEIDVATTHYRNSLKLRPHEAVQKRLSALGVVTGETPWRPETLSWSCAATSKLDGLCACLVAEADKQTKKTDPDGLTSCEVDDRGPTAMIELHTATHRYQLLAGKSSKGWQLATELADEYRRDALGSREQAHVIESELTVDGRKILWYEVSKSRSHSDPGINEEESSSITSLTICLLETEDLRCIFKAPLAEEYWRGYLVDEEVGSFDKEEFADLHTKGLPIERRGALQAEIKPDGSLHVSLESGEATSLLGQVIGRHPLW